MPKTPMLFVGQQPTNENAQFRTTPNKAVYPLVKSDNYLFASYFDINSLTHLFNPCVPAYRSVTPEYNVAQHLL